MNFNAMAHRGDTLGKDVCCIDDLKRLGSQRLTPLVRDYYNEGAIDLITNVSASHAGGLEWGFWITNMRWTVR
ncbi:hypothetical protein BDW68DRAFT_180837 [Aspergillus falconensis]